MEHCQKELKEWEMEQKEKQKQAQGLKANLTPEVLKQLNELKLQLKKHH